MALPYMPLYIDDYLKDTIYLTAEEHGAYILLIMHYWQKERALDNKDGRLAKVVRMPSKRWAVVQQSLKEFFTIENDVWTHGRIEFELTKAFEKSKHARYAASVGVRKRANEKLAFAEPSLSEKEKEEQAKKNKEEIESQFQNFWNLYPRKDGEKGARVSFEKALKISSLEVILEGVTRYVQFLKTATQDTAMPATWLNGERWNDQNSSPASTLNSATPEVPHKCVVDSQTHEPYCESCGQTWPCNAEQRIGGADF